MTNTPCWYKAQVYTEVLSCAWDCARSWGSYNAPGGTPTLTEFSTLSRERETSKQTIMPHLASDRVEGAMGTRR